jgi:TolB-like protein/Tfp pilus assembly protein PilF
MAEVFISYARSDEAAARRAAKALAEAGLEVWWDEDLPAHRAYSDVIERKLEDCEAVLVLWSKAAAASQWVRAEADFGRNAGKLVQGTVDGSMPPLPFNQIQCADLKGWRGNRGHPGWTKLEQSVLALAAGEGQAPPPKPVPERWWAQRRFQLAALAALLLVIAAGFFVSRYLFGESGERPVVAVLPFKSLDQRDTSLVAGIWEDTRQAISRNPQLLVLGPNTAERLAEEGEEAARKAADYLVEASVRSVGDRIRVNTNLVRTEDGAQLWSENFDRRLDDVFALQSEIAREIEGRIRGRLARSGGVQPEHIATSGEVYALYSEARTAIRKRQVSKYQKARQQLEEVVRKDPSFAPGWATLAVSKRFDEEEGAEADARRAIALAPSLAAAHAALGFTLGQGPAAQASLRRALELDPNDIEAMNWLANSLEGKAEAQEKLKLYSRIVEIEPLWWPAILNKSNLLFELGKRGALEREIARLRQLGDDAVADQLQMQLMRMTGDLSGLVSLGLARYESATAEQKEQIGQSLFTSLLLLGYTEEADQMFPPPGPYIKYIRANDPRALDMFEAQFQPRQYWKFGALGIVGTRVYLLNGQGPRLAKIYNAAASSPQEFEALIGKQRLPDYAPGAALALRSGGDEAQARELLALAEDRANDLSDSLDRQITLARIHAVQGRTDVAIGELSAAIRGGWLPPYLPINTDIATDPPLAELKKDPRFEQLRQQILRHIAKERAELGPITLN